MPEPLLAALPYEAWEPTKTTLHLWAQIVGKVRLRFTWPRNHWWNVTLYPSERGLTTGRMRDGETSFAIEFDFVDHRLLVRTNRMHRAAEIALHDGLSVAEFYETLLGQLRAGGVRASILAKPYGVPVETPFAQDFAHCSYDAQAVRRWWNIVLWSADVFDEYASDFAGKASPAHLFWHSFDLALARFNGRRSTQPPPADPVAREAYSHEVIAVGFWAGDAKIPAPTYYTYTAPEPKMLTDIALEPPLAAWVPSGAGHLGTLAYDVVREASDPRATLLSFLRSGYAAGAKSAGWNVGALKA